MCDDKNDFSGGTKKMDFSNGLTMTWKYSFNIPGLFYVKLLSDFAIKSASLCKCTYMYMSMYVWLTDVKNSIV